MSVRSTCRAVVGACLLPFLLAGIADGQSLLPDGAEYPLVGSLPGDQVFSSLALSPRGGFVVWQDSVIDGRGFGIALQRLDGSYSPAITAPIRVNQTLEGGQEKPRVALLPSGGAVVVWQGGVEGSQKVYGRFIADTGVFATDELAVGGITKGEQIDPAVAVLADGKVVIIWSVFGEDGSLQGVFARIYTGQGAATGPAFQVNQFSTYNQRNPDVTALAGGGFVVVWISEQQRHVATESDPWASVDVYARRFSGAGVASTDEFLVNASPRTCANPAISASGSGGFLVAWTERAATKADGWDIAARYYDSSNTPASAPTKVNTYLAGDQYVPAISSVDDRQLVVWTSMGQDGHREGVFAQLTRNGAKVGGEFLVNSVTASRQIQPSVSSDGNSRFLIAWSSFLGRNSMDLHAQRFSFGAPLPIPAAPYLTALSGLALQVAWPELKGYSLDRYELSVDDGPALKVTAPPYSVTQLQPGTTHQARIRFVLTDGNVSKWSPPGSGVTWGEDDNLDGLPDDWQRLYFGNDDSLWPASNVDSDGDGATNAQEFRAGTDPRDPASVLRQHFVRENHGTWLVWNTVPGMIYQVDRCDAFGGSWVHFGAPRFAASTTDSILLSPESKSGFFRVTRLR